MDVVYVGVLVAVRVGWLDPVGDVVMGPVRVAVGVCMFVRVAVKLIGVACRVFCVCVGVPVGPLVSVFVADGTGVPAFDRDGTADRVGDEVQAALTDGRGVLVRDIVMTGVLIAEGVDAGVRCADGEGSATIAPRDFVVDGVGFAVSVAEVVGGDVIVTDMLGAGVVVVE